MDNSLLITLGILAAALVAFLTEKIPADLTALLVAVALGLTGVLTPEEAFSGFSRAAVIIIIAIFILAEGLKRTGVTEKVGLTNPVDSPEDAARAVEELANAGVDLIKAQSGLSAPYYQAIVKAARELFLQEGFDVSVDAIAAEAGVSKVTVYNHFGTKADLFIGVIMNGMEEAQAVAAREAELRKGIKAPSLGDELAILRKQLGVVEAHLAHLQQLHPPTTPEAPPAQASAAE